MKDSPIFRLALFVQVGIPAARGRGSLVQPDSYQASSTIWLTQ